MKKEFVPSEDASTVVTGVPLRSPFSPQRLVKTISSVVASRELSTSSKTRKVFLEYTARAIAWFDVSRHSRQLMVDVVE
jgi:hypothetical protein